ncbi:MAG: deoxyribodipyrimidine photolyase [Rhodocyclaceae bacterium]|nr:deoxyribodipyrimidine photolyase [Rhodocyclaceae bacterium]
MPDTDSLRGKRYLRLHQRGRNSSANAEARVLRDIESELDHFAPTQADFPPTREEALRRMAAIDTRAYRRYRDYARGPVSRLSPYITHGLLSVPEVFSSVVARGESGPADRFVQELAWREFFRHVWRHLGDGIVEDIRDALPGVLYTSEMPADVLSAATGVPVIDASVRELYATGYLHNHQRMWLASYLVHMRKIHWRAGADWMYGYLLDGDLPSNHLSWQWIASTFSRRPYLFNADNVQRFAAHLSSRGTGIDRGYEELGQIAASNVQLEPEAGGLGQAVSEPGLLALPPALAPAAEPPLIAGNERVAWVHPWSLGARPDADRVIGVIHRPFHAQFPWSEHRWAFVIGAMRKVCDEIWIGDLQRLAQIQGGQVAEVQATLNPGYREAIATLPGARRPEPRLTPDPDDLKPSFSRFWEHVLATRSINFSPVG